MEYKVSEIKEKIGMEILEAQMEASSRNEQLEAAQIEDIISKYGELQEDGDTIHLNDIDRDVSLLDIYNGTIVETGSYTQNKAKIELLESQIKLLQQQIETDSQSHDESYNNLSSNYTTLQTNYNNLSTQYTTLQTDYNNLSTQHTTLQTNYNNLLSSIVDYDSKTYTTTGITIYNNHVEILSGGYFEDNDGTVYVNITLKQKTKFNSSTSYVVLQGFSNIVPQFFTITDTENKYAFTFRNGELCFFDRLGVSLPAGTTYTIQFKCKK